MVIDIISRNALASGSCHTVTSASAFSFNGEPQAEAKYGNGRLRLAVKQLNQQPG
jgi:hypothetical protein